MTHPHYFAEPDPFRPVRTFASWKARIALLVRERTGCGLDELPDHDYRSLFDRGLSAVEAAWAVIRVTTVT